MAALTLNNLSFNVSLFLLHDAPSVFTTLCSRFLTRICTSNIKKSLNNRYLWCCLYVLSVLGNRLTFEVHRKMFCSTGKALFCSCQSFTDVFIWKDARMCAFKGGISNLGRLKISPSEHHGWILVETPAPLCCNLKKALVHLVIAERGRSSVDRMMYYLVWLDDNFISCLRFHQCTFFCGNF